MLPEHFKIILLSFPHLYRFENPGNPRQTVATRRAPTTRFTSKEPFDIADHADRTRRVIEDYHRSGTQPAPHLRHRLVVHRGVEVFRKDEVSGAAPGDHCP
jgi:hypothetical protein